MNCTQIIDEIWLLAFNLLSIQDFFKIRQTCKHFYQLTDPSKPFINNYFKFHCQLLLHTINYCKRLNYKTKRWHLIYYDVHSFVHLKKVHHDKKRSRKELKPNGTANRNAVVVHNFNACEIKHPHKCNSSKRRLRIIFLEACKLDCLRTFKMLSKQKYIHKYGINQQIHVASSGNATALYVSAFHLSEKTFNYLASNSKVDLNVRCTVRNDTPLHAIIHQLDKKQLKTMISLHNENVSAAFMKNRVLRMVQTLIFYSHKRVHKKKRLQSKSKTKLNKNDTIGAKLGGIDINCQDSKGRTALYLACVYNSPEIVSILIKNGCDINIQDFVYNQTALEVAIQRKHQQIVQMISKI